jgi:hypothetical protein
MAEVRQRAPIDGVSTSHSYKPGGVASRESVRRRAIYEFGIRVLFRLGWEAERL